MIERKEIMVGKRQHARAKLTYPIFVKAHRRLLSAETEDISAGGLFIRCREPLKPEEVLDLLIGVPVQDKPIRATAEVVRSQKVSPDNELEPLGMAVKFRIISDRDREIISTLVSDHLKSN